jgi:hypothetical protein
MKAEPQEYKTRYFEMRKLTILLFSSRHQYTGVEIIPSSDLCYRNGTPLQPLHFS